MTIRVALVDDQALFRAGIAMVVGSQEDLEVVGEAGDGAEALALVEQCRPDVLLMDVRMPRLDGVQATRQIVSHLGDQAPRVLVLTTFDLDELVADAIDAGASGFVLKESRPEMLLAAIRAVADGTQVVAAGATQAVFERYRARVAAAPGDEYATAHPARTRGPAPCGPWTLQRGDRRRRVPLRGDREDPHVSHPHQARPPRPRAARRLRLRARPDLTVVLDQASSCVCAPASGLADRHTSSGVVRVDRWPDVAAHGPFLAWSP